MSEAEQGGVTEFQTQVQPDALIALVMGAMVADDFVDDEDEVPDDLNPWVMRSIHSLNVMAAMLGHPPSDSCYTADKVSEQA